VKALAVNLVHAVNRRFPGSATLHGLDTFTVDVHVTSDDADAAASFLSASLPPATHVSLDAQQFETNGFLIVLTCPLTVARGMRVLASTLLDLDEQTDGALREVLARRVDVTGVLLEDTDWGNLVPGGADNLLLARFDQARSDLPFNSSVPLDPAGEILAVLLLDAAVAAGIDPNRSQGASARAAAEIVVQAVLDMSDENQYVVEVARELALVRPPMRVAASTRTDVKLTRGPGSDVSQYG
jgi:hypothetical protein